MGKRISISTCLWKSINSFSPKNFKALWLSYNLVEFRKSKWDVAEFQNGRVEKGASASRYLNHIWDCNPEANLLCVFTAMICTVLITVVKYLENWAISKLPPRAFRRHCYSTKITCRPCSSGE